MAAPAARAHAPPAPPSPPHTPRRHGPRTAPSTAGISRPRRASRLQATSPRTPSPARQTRCAERAHHPRTATRVRRALASHAQCACPRLDSGPLPRFRLPLRRAGLQLRHDPPRRPHGAHLPARPLPGVLRAFPRCEAAVRSVQGESTVECSFSLSATLIAGRILRGNVVFSVFRNSESRVLTLRG